VNRLSNTLQRGYDRIYTGPLKRLVRWLGLNEILSTPYWKLVFTLSDDTRTHTVGNETVMFRTTTFSEFRRFDDLVGERPILEDVLHSLNESDVFYDIGANVGTYTCFAASKLGAGNVIGFEPERKNAARLRENLAQNDLDAQVFEVALSNTDGTIELELAGEDAGEGEHSIAIGEPQETIEVKTAKGDTFIETHAISVPSVIKIDVEGAELSVLQGMEQALRNHCRLVYVEIHPNKLEEHGGTPAEVHSLLEEMGFEVKWLEQRGNQHFIRAEQKGQKSGDKTLAE